MPYSLRVQLNDENLIVSAGMPHNMASFRWCRRPSTRTKSTSVTLIPTLTWWRASSRSTALPLYSSFVLVINALPSRSLVASSVKFTKDPDSRAGSSSIGEATVLGKPLVLVPYPYAAGHQKYNAAAVEEAGAALVIPDEKLSGAKLAEVVLELRQNEQRRTAMAEASAGWGRPEAAQDIARILLEVWDEASAWVSAGPP